MVNQLSGLTPSIDLQPEQKLFGNSIELEDKSSISNINNNNNNINN